MKKLLVFIIVLAGGLLTYNYVTTGELRLMPDLGGSAEDRQVRTLETEFSAAAAELAQAGRTAGLSGMDTSSQAAAALARIGRLEKEASALGPELQEAGARARLAGLLAEMQRARDGR
jgi:hypothetical protein